MAQLNLTDIPQDAIPKVKVAIKSVMLTYYEQKRDETAKTKAQEDLAAFILANNF